MQLDDRLLVIAECGGSFSLRAVARQPTLALSRTHQAAQVVPPKPERFLICGNSSKLAFALQELNAYVAPKSVAVLLPGAAEKTIHAALKSVLDRFLYLFRDHNLLRVGC